MDYISHVLKCFLQQRLIILSFTQADFISFFLSCTINRLSGCHLRCCVVMWNLVLCYNYSLYTWEDRKSVGGKGKLKEGILTGKQSGCTQGTLQYKVSGWGIN